MAKEFVLKSQAAARKLKVDYRSELNQEQYRVVTEAEGPCLVLAGAGSGKTRTIVYRVAYLIEQGVKPENILLVTFTNKAAKEMLRRAELLLGRYPEKLWGGTFHHIGNRLLRQYAKLLGYQANFTILDEEDSKDLIKVCLKDEGVDIKARRFPSPAVIKDLLSYAKNSQTKLKEVIELRHPKWIEIEDRIAAVGSRYEAKKKVGNAMDFDDLLVNWLKLLKQEAGVKDRLGAQFHYILVDEYQDTNYIQAAIIKELASVYQNVLVVGDDAQSIYSFRAADIGNILNFPKIFPKAKIFKLQTNYRSTPEILKVANQVISQNLKQYPKVLKPRLQSFVRPNLIPASSAAQEAEFITQQILELRDEGLPLNKMAVLFRAAHHSQELEFSLTKKDIPYEYRGGVRFFERAHIKDAVAFLKVINNPKDEAAWLRIMNLQVGIGFAIATKIYQRIKDLDCIVKCAAADLSDVLTAKAKIGWQSLTNIFLNDLRVKALKDLSDPAGLIRSVAKSDYRNYLEAQYPNWQERLEDLEQLAKFAENYAEVNSFLSEVVLQEAFGVERGRPDYGDEEKLILTTIHQAKGLEWEAVFIINLIDTAFPNRRAQAGEGGLEEERRLFYVAITRAQKQLFFSYPLVSSYASMYLNTPSQFLSEIDDKLLEEVKLVEGKRDFADLSNDEAQYLPEV
ncbi:MAG TPA: ATP-dependent helicase [Patescibacteria group bacterium]|nr:ATP-dependent helicase [Patescibacteria group bacterium]